MQLKYVLGGQMEESMRKYHAGDPPIMKAWDLMQTELKCCGVHDKKDWVRHYRNLPNSCCENLPVGRNSVCKLFDKQFPSYDQGCVAAMEQSVLNNEEIIAAIVAITAIIQIALIMAACHLMKVTKKRESCYPFY